MTCGLFLNSRSFRIVWNKFCYIVKATYDIWFVFFIYTHFWNKKHANKKQYKKLGKKYATLISSEINFAIVKATYDIWLARRKVARDSEGGNCYKFNLACAHSFLRRHPRIVVHQFWRKPFMRKRYTTWQNGLLHRSEVYTSLLWPIQPTYGVL